MRRNIFGAIMKESLNAKIVTPFKDTFDDIVKSCTLPGSEGSFQVLKGHAPLLSLIDIGEIKIETSKEEIKFFATSGGFCEVKDNIIKIIVETAEDSNDIDIKRATKAKERAENRLKENSENLDFDRVKGALARAINRLHLHHISS